MPRFHSHGVMSRSSGCLIALVLGLHAAAFVGVGKLFTEEQRVPKTNLRAVDVAAEPEVDTQALLTGERYIASNRFMVREGAEAAFEQRWAKRKSSLLTLPGFRWFSLMRRLPNDQQSFPDEYSYVSFTIWETKKDFTFWRKGPAFKEAHGGGGILDFVGMVMSSFMTSKGPPKPSFWRGLLPLKSAEQRDRLVSGPGGRPEADGEELLEPEVFVATTRFNVLDQSKTEFEQLWNEQKDKLQDTAGFRFSQLLRRDQAPDDNCNYLSVTVWDDKAAYEQSKAILPPGDMLLQPAQDILYEGKLVLERDRKSVV